MLERAVDTKWARLIEELELAQVIEDQGYVDISAEQFKSLDLEIRLMTKIDHSHQRPRVFEELDVNILTLGRSLWRVGRFETQTHLPEFNPPSSQVKVKAIPNFVQSLDPSYLTSEAGVLNAAQLAGIVDDFLEGEYLQTVSGRMSSGDFSFQLAERGGTTSEIFVSKAQIEIDAGYESPSNLALFEAKISGATDFCTRQLYYPFRVWSARLPHKPVRTVYVSYANQFLDLFEFEFKLPNLYSSSQLIRKQRYTLGSDLPSSEEVDRLSDRVTPATPPRDRGKFIPFPQADSFERVMDLVGFITAGPKSDVQIIEKYGFVRRQADYYPNAAAYLGLVRKTPSYDGEKVWTSTPEGRRLMSLPMRERSLAFAELLFSVQPIAETFQVWKRLCYQPSRDWVVQQLHSSPYAVQENGEKLGATTISRRASTVISWASWLVNLRS